MRRVKSIIAVLLVVVALLGCANMTPTQQSTLSGGAIGAAGGAAISAIAGGNAGIGAAVGGAAGALTGYLVGQHKYGY
jgi:hypothetical protein